MTKNEIVKVIDNFSSMEYSLEILSNPYIPASVTKKLLKVSDKDRQLHYYSKSNVETSKLRSEFLNMPEDEILQVKGQFKLKLSTIMSDLGEIEIELIKHLERNLPFLSSVAAPYILNTPAKIASHVKSSVKGQDQAIDKTCTFFFVHLLRSGIIKPRSMKVISEIQLPRFVNLIQGGTGTGKTFIIEKLASLFDLPIEIVNASSLVTEGYVGPQVSDIYTSLFLRKHPLSQYAIIVIDEFDKLSRSDLSVKGVAIQNELLSIIQGSAPVQHRTAFHSQAPFAYSITKNNSFFLLGAFTGMNINPKTSSIGFKASTNEKMIVKSEIVLLKEALIRYGIITELAGRINTYIRLADHTYESLRNILVNSSDSPIKPYQELFSLYNDELFLTDDMIDHIIQEALVLNSGARGLSTLLVENLQSKFFDLLSR